jgi:hypothetical protein
MKLSRGLLAVGLVLWLTGCVHTSHTVANDGFKAPRGNYKLMVMQPDISVGVLTAGGSFEFREDWTRQATQNVIKALKKQRLGRGVQTKVAVTREDTGADPALVADLVWLHTAVGEAVRTHKFGAFPVMPLPTKQNRLDWTLGEPAMKFGAATKYDYALFLHATDSFSSGARKALYVASILTGREIQTGSQRAYASLVDLKTGQLVWFNTTFSNGGDIRTPEGADDLVGSLLEIMQPDETTRGP